MAAAASVAISDWATAGSPGSQQTRRRPGAVEWRPPTLHHAKVDKRDRKLRRPERQLHVLDVENLLGGTHFTPAEVSRLRTHYASATAMTRLAQVVVGASADGSAIASGLGWTGAGVRMRRGQDGADLELVEVLAHEQVADRFEEVFIGSGDGIFAPLAAQLASQGVSVTVVSRRAALANALRIASRRVIYLDVPSPAWELFRLKVG